MSEFEHWEKRFSVPEYVFGTAPNVFLARQAHLLPSTGTALAVADGEGRNGVWLAERGLDVLSIDWSPTAQAKAVALAKARGVRMRTAVADLLNWTWPVGTYDVVVAIFIQFLTPSERTTVFAAMRDALKPGGPSEVENLYTRAMLEAEFASLSELTIAEHDSFMSEGTRHVGMAAVI